MYVQDPNIKPNSEIPKALFNENSSPAKIADWISFSAGEVLLGLDSSDHAHHFGWDIESPCTKRKVEPFSMQSRPVTAGEYFDYFNEHSCDEELLPGSWLFHNNTWTIKTVYGPIPLKMCLNWPVSVSHHQATLYASYHGARLPTEEEISFSRSRFPLENSDNYGFTKLTPVDVRSCSDRVTDLAASGWELTSTVLRPFDGFIKDDLYPGYSSDFL